MRVVHVISSLDVGGAEHALRRLVLSIARDDSTEHVVISLTTIGQVGELLRSAGVAVEALGMRSTLSLPTALLRLKRRLKALSPDVVQGWMYHGDLLGGLAARWSQQGRVVWGVRSSSLVAGTPLTTLATRWICARLSSRVPDVIVCAAEAGRRVHEAIGYDAAKTRVIPNGFAFNESDVVLRNNGALRDELGWMPNEVVVGMVGRFHAIKGIDHFVEAAGLLAQRFPALRFVMVGRGLDRSNEELMQWIAQHGLNQQMSLLGERSDVSQCLAAMDVFVLSSRSEGFPNVVGEAMAQGVPCVVADVGDAALLVGDTGRVVPPNSPRALANAVSQLLALAPAEREALGAEARLRIREKFSLARSSASYSAMYAELSGPRPRAR